MWKAFYQEYIYILNMKEEYPDYAERNLKHYRTIVEDMQIVCMEIISRKKALDVPWGWRFPTK